LYFNFHRLLYKIQEKIKLEKARKFGNRKYTRKHSISNTKIYG
jgi:hypothetical protein